MTHPVWGEKPWKDETTTVKVATDWNAIYQIVGPGLERHIATTTGTDFATDSTEGRSFFEWCTAVPSVIVEWEIGSGSEANEE